MSSKKRICSADSSESSTSSGFADGVSFESKSDQESFLQAFEKPTQIYRFLRTRHIISPIFIHRTLTYMERMSRTHKQRRLFKVDSFLKQIEERKISDAQSERNSGNLTLVFRGVFDKNNERLDDLGVTHMNIEAVVTKMSYKKRKDVAAEITEQCVGQTEVPYNPNTPSVSPSVITIYKDNLGSLNGHSIKSYSLILTGKFFAKSLHNEDLENGDGPAIKRRKRITSFSCQYTCELVIFDKFQRCLLTEGEYQILLQEDQNSKIQKSHKYYMKNLSWEPLSSDIAVENKFINSKPILVFHLLWGDSAIHESPNFYQPSSHLLDPFIKHKSTFFLQNDDSSLSPSESRDCYSSSFSLRGIEYEQMKSSKKLRVFYQFLSNNTLQHTHAKEDFRCPWCSLNCMQLYSLIKHLKLCHSRFCFKFVPHAKGQKIVVTINETYDGSYSGNPHDLSYSTTGYAFSRNGPVKRMPVTHILVCRPKRLPQSLSEFLEPEDPEDGCVKPYVYGHNRLYYHTKTCAPIKPQEMDEDSEGENDPHWMRTKTQLMIDEFTDVNEGEKEVMKLWNLHIMNHGFVGDCQIAHAVNIFVEENGQEIIRRKLFKNFVVHLTNLSDFGLLSTSSMLSTIRKLQEIATDTNDFPVIKEECQKL